MVANDLARTAQSFSEGILSAKITAILSRERGALLSRDDLTEIDAGRRLVLDILCGAETVTRLGCGSGQATARSIGTLGIALTPLERVRASLQPGEPTESALVHVLSKMEEALGTLTSAHQIPEPTPALETAREFFGLLADAILASIDHLPVPSSPVLI